MLIVIARKTALNYKPFESRRLALPAPVPQAQVSKVEGMKDETGLMRLFSVRGV